MTDVNLTGCTVCGDDYEDGDRYRVWQCISGPASAHDRCYYGLTTRGRAYRERTWPKMTAAPVITFHATPAEVTP